MSRQLSRQLSRQSSVGADKEEAPPERNILIQEETTEEGNVSFNFLNNKLLYNSWDFVTTVHIQVKLSVFITYVKACTYYMILTVLFFYFLSNVAAVGSNFWLAHWTNVEGSRNSSLNESDDV